MRRLAAMALVLAACTSAGAPEGTSPAEAPIETTTPSSTDAGTVDGVPGAAGIGDRLYPFLGNGGYDVERYRFDIEVAADWSIEADAQIVLVPLEDLSGLNLDLSGLEVRSVEVEGFDGVDFEHVDRELIVDFGATAAAGEPLTLTLAYSGVPSSVPADAVPFRPGWQLGEDVGYLFSQPDGAQSLFPVNDHPSDRADVELSITTPSGVEAVSGGTVVSETQGPSTDTVVWEMTDVAPYLIPLAIGQLTLVSDRMDDGVRYDVWVSDALVDLPAIDAFDRQPEIVRFFAERFGPYPFDRAGAIIVDDDLGAALETQTIPTYSATSARWGEIVIAHELAHQWFGDSIALEQWDDIWLNEGFATFAHWLWMEERFGSTRYDSEVEAAYRALSGLELTENGIAAGVAADRVREAFPPPDDPRPTDLFNRSVYERGGLTLVALRDAVGDEALFDLFGTYTERYRGETITTEGFIDLVDEVLGSQAASLISSWISDSDIPPLPERGLTPPSEG